MVQWVPIAGSRAIIKLGLERVTPADGPERVRIHVQFRDSRRTYVYDVGDVKYYDVFVSVASKGRYYNFVIKRRFDYVAKY